VSAEGRLLTCGEDYDDGEPVGLGHGDDVEVVPVPTIVPGLAAVRVTSVSTGDNHTLAVSEDGAVYSFGLGDRGRLGHGDEENQLAPRVIEGLLGVRACEVSAGDVHSLVLAASGAVFSFGWGGDGRLGHGDQSDQPTPKVIEELRSVRVCAVAAGGDHSLVLGAGGEVYSFGNGVEGRLGHGNTAIQLTPQVIKALKGVKVRAVSAGWRHSLVLGSAGEVYSFGRGVAMGHGDEEQNQKTPKVIEALAGVKVCAVAVGADHSLVLSEDGVVCSFGFGDDGRLGHGHKEDQLTPKAIEALLGVKVSSIAAGVCTSLVVAASGVAYGWGSEDESLGLGALGLAENQLVPLQYPTEQLLCAKE